MLCDLGKFNCNTSTKSFIISRCKVEIFRKLMEVIVHKCPKRLKSNELRKSHSQEFWVISSIGQFRIEMDSVMWWKIARFFRSIPQWRRNRITNFVKNQKKWKVYSKLFFKHCVFYFDQQPRRVAPFLKSSLA